MAKFKENDFKAPWRNTIRRMEQTSPSIESEAEDIVLSNVTKVVDVPKVIAVSKTPEPMETTNASEKINGIPELAPGVKVQAPETRTIETSTSEVWVKMPRRFKKPHENKTKTGYSFRPSLVARLKNIADKEGMSTSAIMDRAFVEFCDRVERENESNDDVSTRDLC